MLQFPPPPATVPYPPCAEKLCAPDPAVVENCAWNVPEAPARMFENWPRGNVFVALPAPPTNVTAVALNANTAFAAVFPVFLRANVTR
jgi:hypothetical protein